MLKHLQRRNDHKNVHTSSKWFWDLFWSLPASFRVLLLFELFALLTCAGEWLPGEQATGSIFGGDALGVFNVDWMICMQTNWNREKTKFLIILLWKCSRNQKSSNSNLWMTWWTAVFRIHASTSYIMTWIIFSAILPFFFFGWDSISIVRQETIRYIWRWHRRMMIFAWIITANPLQSILMIQILRHRIEIRWMHRRCHV